MARGWMVLVLVVAALLPLVGGCGEEAEPPVMAAAEPLPLSPSLVDDTIVPGGSLLLEVRGAELLRPRSITVTLSGTIDGRTAEGFALPLYTSGEDALLLEVSWADLRAALGVEGDQTFTGNIIVQIEDVDGQLEGLGALTQVSLVFPRALTPGLELQAEQEQFLNALEATGGDNILRPGEGQTWLQVRGTFTREVDGVEVPIDGRVPVNIGDQGRFSAQIRWLPTLFGVRPGVFEGKVTPVNAHALGDEISGDASSLRLVQRATELDGFAAPGASRGQVATALGRGFIPSNPSAGQGMYFELEGLFRLVDGTTLPLSGDSIVRLAPESVPGSTEARVVLRTELDDDGVTPRLTGITAMPGTFEGTITPVLVEESLIEPGRPWTGQFTVNPTRQVVFVKFLPGFSTSLDTYGLRNVEPELRARIFEVVRRDYARWNVEFLDHEPDDFVEYSRIEVGGPDPNGAGLFGLDNSAGKDTGNIRLNDWVGGSNAESSDLGYYTFGGVFIDSFRAFSPRLMPTSPLKDDAFDAIFSPFMADLGGTSVDAQEVTGGARADKIDLAVNALGSIIGNTITHEIGHSLGLSYYPEDDLSPGQRFHNDTDEPGVIMDDGSSRPFGERAELDGFEPPHFNARNAEYLDRILPRP